MRKLTACLLETALWVGTPLVVLSVLSTSDPGAWRAAGLGALGFALALILGQYVFARALVNVWRRRAERMGLQEEARRAYLAPRLYATGATFAAFMEEGAKLLLLLWLLPTAPEPLRLAAALGVGHGGLEAIFFGLLIGIVGVLDVVIPDKMANLTLDGIRRTSALEHLIGLVERLAILVVQTSAALLVAQTVLRGNPLWLLLAIAHHFAQDYIWVTCKSIAGWSQIRLLWIGLTSAVLSVVWVVLSTM